jgi:NtrC-family two-component system sensor histidine kinase KinB
LTATTGKALQTTQETIDLSATLSDALEREDDALLLAVSGDAALAAQKLSVERNRFAEN